MSPRFTRVRAKILDTHATSGTFNSLTSFTSATPASSAHHRELLSFSFGSRSSRHYSLIAYRLQ